MRNRPATATLQRLNEAIAPPEDAPFFLYCRQLHRHGVDLEILNLGVGFPAVYEGHPAIPVAEIVRHVHAAASDLPYRMGLVVEPGRRIVANSITLFSTAVSRVARARWT